MSSKSKGLKSSALERLRKENSPCRKSAVRLGASYVFGTGDPDAKLMFVGEAPGLEEDRLGQPFVGRAGKLLNKLIESIGLKREQVYITNVVKFHPMKDPEHPEKRGNDRAPTREEIGTCLPVLEKEIDVIQPGIICTLGNTATKSLLKTKDGTGKLHGFVHTYRGKKLIPTYHPAAVLRNPFLMDTVLKDMKVIKKELS